MSNVVCVDYSRMQKKILIPRRLFKYVFFLFGGAAKLFGTDYIFKTS